MTGKPTDGFEAAMRDRLSDPESTGTVLVIGDGPAVAIARRLAAGCNANVQVIDPASVIGRIKDLLSGIDPAPPPGFFPWLRDAPPIEPPPMPERERPDYGWRLHGSW